MQNLSSDAHEQAVPEVITDTEVASGSGWTRFGFVVVNLWLVFHLFAIVICPAAVEPTSPLLVAGFKAVSPYLHAFYLDHAFHYFAPDPGPSTLVSYQLEFADGTTSSGQFPNRSLNPRLYYHRHFMLTEFLGNGPEELRPLIGRAFARNLCRETGAIRVTLAQVTHETALISDILRGRTLNESSLFSESSLGNYTADELNQPFRPSMTDSKTSPVDSTGEWNAPPLSTDDPKELP